jgi:flagellar biosynthesis/type III secretory pathway M-ring protein FliF/YscJ
MIRWLQNVNWSNFLWNLFWAVLLLAIFILIEKISESLKPLTSEEERQRRESMTQEERDKEDTERNAYPY